MIREEQHSIFIEAQASDVRVSIARGSRAGIEFELSDGRSVYLKIGHDDLMRLAKKVRAREMIVPDKKLRREIQKRRQRRDTKRVQAIADGASQRKRRTVIWPRMTGRRR